MISVCLDPVSGVILKNVENTFYEDCDLSWIMTTMIGCDRCRLHAVNFARYSPTDGWKNNGKIKSMINHQENCKNKSGQPSVVALLNKKTTKPPTKQWKSYNQTMAKLFCDYPQFSFLGMEGFHNAVINIHQGFEFNLRGCAKIRLSKIKLPRLFTASKPGILTENVYSDSKIRRS